MIPKIALIKESSFDASNYPVQLRNSFVEIVRNGITYMYIKTFENYTQSFAFDLEFDTDHEYQSWLTKFENKYFLLPVELIPSIKQYAGFVNEAYIELIFDVTIEKDTVDLTVGSVLLPSNSVKVLPCSCKNWTKDGQQVLEAVIENWNVTYPSKLIDFQYRFESFAEFEAFRTNYLNF